MNKMIGMARNINLEWLNQTANLVLADKSEEEIKQNLNEYLSFVIESPTNIRKTREILMNIWVRTPDEYVGLKKLALKVYNKNSNSNKILAHWCLMLITYQVFTDICSVIGKMNDKQFDISTNQIKDKMFDVWGERPTLYHSISKLIKTIKDMGIIAPIKSGLYKVNKFIITDDDAIILIVATLLCLKDKLYLSIEELENSFELFPFEYNINLELLQGSNKFVFDRFGGEMVISKMIQ